MGGMPWKVSNAVDLRSSFVARYLAGESMSALCREHGISRKTGYKFVERHRLLGESGLLNASRRPLRSSKKTPSEIVVRIVALREQHPTWGPRTLRDRLQTLHPDVVWPSRTTIAKILHLRQLSKPQRRRRRIHPSTQPLSHALAPNDLWCIDYKGQFRLGDGSYCYPLTVTDGFSRLLLVCEGFESISFEDVQGALIAAFFSYGMPKAIRSDNGPPFASSRSSLGWSRFTPWLAKLGIAHERIDPGKPQQNGRHERMHRTLKAETTRPAQKTLCMQQEKFDAFRHVYNEERPHQALGGVAPSTIYQPSPRKLPKILPAPSYPLHDLVRRVLHGGTVLPLIGHRFHLSTTLVDEHVGLREVEPGRWLVSFLHFDLGHYDENTRKFDPCGNEAQRIKITKKKP